MNILHRYKSSYTDVHLLMDRIYHIEESKKREGSLGELKVATMLSDNHTPFIQEHYFEDLINPKTGLFLFFDFYLPTGNTVIEVQGEHHFQPIEGEGKLKYKQYLDSLKKGYCKRKGIRYIEIKCVDGNLNIPELKYGLSRLKKDLRVGFGKSIVEPKKKKKKVKVKPKKKTAKKRIYR
jgi:hypothetical protein